MTESDRHSVEGAAVEAAPSIISSDWIDDSIEDILYVWNERMHPMYKDAFAQRMEQARQMAHRLSGGSVYLADPGKPKSHDSILDMEIPLPIDMMMKRVFGADWVRDDRIYNRFRRRYREGRYNPK